MAKRSTGGVSEQRRHARRAHLQYVSDLESGIKRVKSGGRFRYMKSGRRVTQEKALARIRALAIPPAWTNVWI